MRVNKQFSKDSRTSLFAVTECGIVVVKVRFTVIADIEQARQIMHIYHHRHHFKYKNKSLKFKMVKVCIFKLLTSGYQKYKTNTYQM